MISENKQLDKVYTARNHAKPMDAYRDWAQHYDDYLKNEGVTCKLCTCKVCEK